MIVVDGEGVVMATPEVFAISATLQSNQKTHSEALAKIAEEFARIEADLPRLENLESVRIEASTAAVEPYYDFECAKNARYDQRVACPIAGFIAKIDVVVQGSPAGVAGNALTLLSELGASDVNLSGYSVVDYGAARSEAAALAMKDAKQEAERLANAAGAGIGAPARIQYGKGFDEDSTPPTAALTAFDEDAITVTGSRIAPAVNLVLTPQPFEVKESVTAAFVLSEPAP